MASKAQYDLILTPNLGKPQVEWYSANIADSANIFDNGDTGAANSYLRSDNIQQCARTGVFVQVITLPVPIKKGLTMADDNPNTSIVTAHQKSSLWALWLRLRDHYASSTYNVLSSIILWLNLFYPGVRSTRPG